MNRLASWQCIVSAFQFAINALLFFCWMIAALLSFRFLISSAFSTPSTIASNIPPPSVSAHLLLVNVPLRYREFFDAALEINQALLREPYVVRFFRPKPPSIPASLASPTFSLHSPRSTLRSSATANLRPQLLCAARALLPPPSSHRGIHAIHAGASLFNLPAIPSHFHWFSSADPAQAYCSIRLNSMAASFGVSPQFLDR